MLLGQFLCSRIGGLKRAISDRRPNRVYSYAVEKAPFRSQFFRSSNAAHPVEKVDFFNGMRGWDRSIEKLFEALCISHYPTKHTITPHNSSDAGLTATEYCCCCCCSQRLDVAHPVLRPPAACTVIRWQQCVLSMTFLHHRCCSCARFGDFQRVPTPQPRR